MTNLFRRYYGVIGPAYGFFKVSIDGSTPQRLRVEREQYLYQQLIWSNTSLSPGRHNLTLMHDDTNTTVFGLDFFRSVINNMRR
jgi:hypothetical protein